MGAVARLLLVVLATVGACGAPESGVGLTLRLDATVSEEARTRIARLSIRASGDEAGEFTLPLTRALAREERLLYRPNPTTRLLELEVGALGGDGVPIAAGRTGPLTLSSAAGATADVLLTAVEASPTDGGAPADLRPPSDLAPADMTTAVKRWTLVQHAGVPAAQTLPIQSTGPGHTIIVAVENTPDVVSVGDNAPGGSSVYQAIANARSTCGDLWYTQSSRPGATTITVTLTSGAPASIVAWEVSGLQATAPIEAAATIEGTTSATAQGAQVTSSQGAFVVSVLIVQNAISGLQAGAFTNDESTNGNGWAHLTSSSAPAGTYVTHWTQSPPGASCGSSASLAVAP